MTERVVITGLGAVTPVGVGKELFWKAMLEGTSGVRAGRQDAVASLNCVAYSAFPALTAVSPDSHMRRIRGR